MSRMRLTGGLAALAIGAGFAGCGGDDESGEEGSSVPPPPGESRDGGGDDASSSGGEPVAGTVYVDLRDQGGSGQSGTVTLSVVEGDQTKVAISVTGAPLGAEPAAIRTGTCASPGAQGAIPLTDVEAGQSTSTIDTSLQDLVDTPHVVDVAGAACAEITNE